MFAQNSDHNSSVLSRSVEPFSVYLLVHDAGQLPGQVPVVGLHLIVILLLVLLYQTLVHRQRLAAGVCKLPADTKTLVKKLSLSQRPQSCSWKG